ERKGPLHGRSGRTPSSRHSALQPTPLVKSAQGLIRVFTGMRDRDGISRVGFVDVSCDDPSKVLDVSRVPALDVGVPGAFDDNGVVPTSIVERDGRLYLFYAGYQLAPKVKFLVFGGLAVSSNGGDSFERYSRAPVCDRTDEELYFRVIHSMI